MHFPYEYYFIIGTTGFARWVMETKHNIWFLCLSYSENAVTDDGEDDSVWEVFTRNTLSQPNDGEISIVNVKLWFVMEYQIAI